MLIVETRHVKINFLKSEKKKWGIIEINPAVDPIITIGNMTSLKKQLIGKETCFLEYNKRQNSKRKFIAILIIKTENGWPGNNFININDIGKLANVKQLAIIWYCFIFPVACIEVNNEPAIAVSSEFNNIKRVNITA